MKVFSRMKFRTEGNRWVTYRAGSHINGEGAVMLRDAPTAATESTRRHESGRRSWSENCDGLSRTAPTEGNVKVLSKEKCQVLAERNGWSLERAKGYVDGEICRLRSKKPSKYALIGIDEYSLGFRAGYFERRNGTSVEVVSRLTDSAP